MLEKKIAGYSDEISVAPGERIRFMVSCEPGVDRYRADIVRLISGDRQPDGPGYRDELLPTSVSGEYPGRTQETYCGSYAVVPNGPAFASLDSLSLQTAIFPTLPSLRRACLMAKIDRRRRPRLRPLDRSGRGPRPAARRRRGRSAGVRAWTTLRLPRVVPGQRHLQRRQRRSPSAPAAARLLRPRHVERRGQTHEQRDRSRRLRRAVLDRRRQPRGGPWETDRRDDLQRPHRAPRSRFPRTGGQ